MVTNQAEAKAEKTGVLDWNALRLPKRAFFQESHIKNCANLWPARHTDP